ncbi:uncharacterized protein PADG_02539 [Paracoccidioides brasiliensis Pb18]|uniref:Uncharacterized protein n=1 Tax=Paracoccidioides brasiliensis (strain Pb18) TaxID=502780 RepID=C1G5T4_PARBD|nr:uncharacterized protein PADG_02539 [Paracoccidioides brasiliensis Pb18]EEH46441.2 hypothetical protein PADG_02539 [Paracoccidioides brasiliensis Pb18]
MRKSMELICGLNASRLVERRTNAVHVGHVGSSAAVTRLRGEVESDVGTSEAEVEEDVEESEEEIMGKSEKGETPVTDSEGEDSLLLRGEKMMEKMVAGHALGSAEGSTSLEDDLSRHPQRFTRGEIESMNVKVTFLEIRVKKKGQNYEKQTLSSMNLSSGPDATQSNDMAGCNREDVCWRRSNEEVQGFPPIRTVAAFSKRLFKAILPTVLSEFIDPNDTSSMPSTPATISSSVSDYNPSGRAILKLDYLGQLTGWFLSFFQETMLGSSSLSLNFISENQLISRAVDKRVEQVVRTGKEIEAELGSPNDGCPWTMLNNPPDGLHQDLKHHSSNDRNESPTAQLLRTGLLLAPHQVLYPGPRTKRRGTSETAGSSISLSRGISTAPA